MLLFVLTNVFCSIQNNLILLNVFENIFYICNEYGKNDRGGGLNILMFGLQTQNFLLTILSKAVNDLAVFFLVLISLSFLKIACKSSANNPYLCLQII